jgi:PKD repeat protein
MGEAPVANFKIGKFYNWGMMKDFQFIDLSTGNPTSWHWEFGENIPGRESSSNLQNPFHNYIRFGIFTVSLTVSNAFGSDTKTESNLISFFPDYLKSKQLKITQEYYLIIGKGYTDDINGFLGTTTGKKGIELGRTYPGYETDTLKRYVKNLTDQDKEVTLRKTLNFPSAIGDPDDLDDLLLSTDGETWEDEITFTAKSIIKQFEGKAAEDQMYYYSKTPFFIKYAPKADILTNEKMFGLQLLQFYKEGWEYYTSIPLINPAGGVADCYIPIILDTNGRSRNDEGDVRFASQDGTELEYEQLFKDGKYNYMVKYPSMPLIAELIVYCGNPFVETTSSLHIIDTTDFNPEFDENISPFSEISGEAIYEADNKLKLIATSGTDLSKAAAQAALNKNSGKWEFLLQMGLEEQISTLYLTQNANLTEGYRIIFSTQYANNEEYDEVIKSYMYIEKWDSETSRYVGISNAISAFNPHEDGDLLSITRSDDQAWNIYMNQHLVHSLAGEWIAGNYNISYITFETQTTDSEIKTARISAITHNPRIISSPLFVGNRWDESIMPVYAEVVKEIPDLKKIIQQGLQFLDENQNQIDIFKMEDVRRGAGSEPQIIIAYNNTSAEINGITLKNGMGYYQKGTAFETWKAAFLSLDGIIFGNRISFNLMPKEKKMFYIRWTPPENSEANKDVEWDLILEVDADNIIEVCR